MLFHKAQSKEGAPRRRGLALILDIDVTGATGEFLSQTFNVARFCARKRGEEKDVEEDGSDPARARFRQGGSALDDRLGKLDVEKVTETGREDGNSALSAGAPANGSRRRPETIPVQDSASLSVRLPTPQDSTESPQPFESSPDRTCAPPQAPGAGGTQCDELMWGHLHDQCSQRGCREKDSKAVLKTR